MERCQLGDRTYGALSTRRPHLWSAVNSAPALMELCQLGARTSLGTRVGVVLLRAKQLVPNEEIACKGFSPVKISIVKIHCKSFN